MDSDSKGYISKKKKKLKEEKKIKILEELEKKYGFSENGEGEELEKIYTRYGDYRYDMIEEKLMNKSEKLFKIWLIEELKLYKKKSPYSRYEIKYKYFDTHSHDMIKIISKKEINKDKILTQDEINNKLKEILSLNEDGFLLKNEIFSFVQNYNIIKYESYGRELYNKVNEEFIIDMIKNLDSEFLKENIKGLFDFLYYYTKEK